MIVNFLIYFLLKQILLPEVIICLICLFVLYAISTFVGFLMPYTFYTNEQIYF